MTERTPPKRRKLAHEILGLAGAAFVLAFFLFQFLSLTAGALAEGYLAQRDIALGPGQYESLDAWILMVCLVTAVVFFVALFLFLLGQKAAEIAAITRGVEALQANRMDFTLPVEGNNEITQLAETINYLAAAQRDLQAKERAIQEEKDQLIRILSHDIRTPLTSILSYSELLLSQEPGPETRRDYLARIRKKAEQIRELTDVLLEGGRRAPERFEDGRLLLEQLAAEMEETLEEAFDFRLEHGAWGPFAGTFDVGEFRRIFANLTSNVEKYADPARPVVLTLAAEGDTLVIRQTNGKHPAPPPRESYRIGLNSIRRIALQYRGRVEVEEDGETFTIAIHLSL